MLALRADGHAGPAILNTAARLVGSHEASVAHGGGGIGGQAAALHIAVADIAVVAADHAAQHRAGIGSDIGVDDGAVVHQTVAVAHQHGRVVGEQYVGAVDGHIVDVRAGVSVPEQSGIAVAEGQALDDVLLVGCSVDAAELTGEGIVLAADGLGLGLVCRGQLGEVDV